MRGFLKWWISFKVCLLLSRTISRGYPKIIPQVLCPSEPRPFSDSIGTETDLGGADWQYQSQTLIKRSFQFLEEISSLSSSSI